MQHHCDGSVIIDYTCIYMYVYTACCNIIFYVVVLYMPQELIFGGGEIILTSWPTVYCLLFTVYS